MRALVPWVWIGMVGCPYIPGPPDLSNVPGLDTSSGPRLQATLRAAIDGADLDVAIFDPAEVLAGGEVFLSGNGLETSFSLPPSPEPVDGTVETVDLLFPDPACEGANLAMEVWATSEAATTPVTMATLRIEGYREDNGTALDAVSVPAVICGATRRPGEVDVYDVTIAGDSPGVAVLDWVGEAKEPLTLEVGCTDPESERLVAEVARPLQVQLPPDCARYEFHVAGPDRGDYWLLVR
ncbi:MAG: hypothetical protein KTR31_09770 [Myxococcales bacterium]|nr:hypothetical protein [Myxococcales bacterium]